MNAYALGFDMIEIQTEAAQLGEGFNSLYLSQRPQANLFSEETIQKSMLGKTETPTATVKFFVAHSSRELAKELNIHAQVAAKVAGVGSAGASTDILDEHKFSENRFVFCFQGKAISRRVSLTANPELIESAPAYLEDPETLLGTFGDYYCSELVYGGELVIFATVEAQSSEQKSQIEAKLNGSFSKAAIKGQASASYKNKFTEAVGEAKTTCKIYQAGSVETTKDTTFDGILQYAMKYLNKEHTNNLMRAVYRPVTQLPGIQPAVYKKLDQVLSPLWKRRDTFLEWLGDYQQARDAFREAFTSASDHYLPTAYYEMIDQDLDHRIDKISAELRRNAGRAGLRDPHLVIPVGLPEYYLEKLETREIKETVYWGGVGGVLFNDPVDALEGLTQITLSYNSENGGVINSIRSRILKRGETSNQTVENPVHGGALRYEQTWDVALNQGDRIEGIEVRSDFYVRQVTFWIRRKGAVAPEQKGPFPPEPNPTVKWPSSNVYGPKSNIILVGFCGRSGNWLDALGIEYIVLEPSRSRLEPASQPTV